MPEASLEQVFANARLDANTLEEFINGDVDEFAEPRLNTPYPTLSRAIKEMFENGGLPATPFETYAEMSVSGLENGTYAVVTNDADDSKNGIYKKDSGLYVYQSYNINAKVDSLADASASKVKYIAMSTGLNTISDADSNYKLIVMNQAITAESTLELPKRSGIYFIKNQTLGGYDVTIKTVGESRGVFALKPNEVKAFIHNGSYLEEVNNKKANIDSPVFLGSPKSPTPTFTSSNTDIATTLFTKAVSRGAVYVPLSDTTTTIDGSLSERKTLVFTGTLTKSITITLTQSTSDWVLTNSTKGGFTIYIKGSGQANGFIKLIPNHSKYCYMYSSVLYELNAPINYKDTELSPKSVATKSKLSTEIPVLLCRDGVTTVNSGGQYLRVSKDFGETWKSPSLHDFGSGKPVDWIRQMDNGELLLSLIDTTVTPWGRDVYISSGFEGSGVPTFTKVLGVQREGVTLGSNWGVDTYNNIVLVNEYGAKEGEATSGAPSGVPKGENARYTYMSLDYGKTWKTIFDLNAYAETDKVHPHGVCYDPYWQRIWYTHGDGSDAILYSDDLGDTWTYAHHVKTYNSTTQVVGIKAMPTCLLFGSDDVSNGILRIDRAEGKHTIDGKYKVQVAYKINEEIVRTHLCHSITQAKHFPDAPVLFGFGSESNPAPSIIIATYDGWTFSRLWEDSISQPAGRGIRNVVGVTAKNEVIARSNDGRVVGRWSQINIKV